MDKNKNNVTIPKEVENQLNEIDKICEEYEIIFEKVEKAEATPA
ncbi:MAG: hypothetical protein WC002_08830 [Candidatus Muiribacteriota bacterium]|jgi:hypothetical protein